MCLTWWKCCFYLGSIISAEVGRWGEPTKMLLFKFQSCCDSAVLARTSFQKQKHFPCSSRSPEQCGALIVDENCICDLGYWSKNTARSSVMSGFSVNKAVFIELKFLLTKTVWNIFFLSMNFQNIIDRILLMGEKILHLDVFFIW